MVETEEDGVADMRRAVAGDPVRELVVDQHSVARSTSNLHWLRQVHRGHSLQQRLRALLAEVALVQVVSAGPDCEVASLSPGQVAQEHANQRREVGDRALRDPVRWGVHSVNVWARLRGRVHYREAQRDLPASNTLDLPWPDSGLGKAPQRCFVQEAGDLRGGTKLGGVRLRAKRGELRGVNAL